MIMDKEQCKKSIMNCFCHHFLFDEKKMLLALLMNDEDYLAPIRDKINMLNKKRDDYLSQIDNAKDDEEAEKILSSVTLT